MRETSNKDLTDTAAKAPCTEPFPRVPRRALRWRSIVVPFLVLGLLMLSPGTQEYVVARAQSTPVTDPLERLEAWTSYLREMRDSLDRTHFDLEALAFELAFESPEGIEAWVRAHIAYEPYEGVLRGAEGTLLSRAGNAIDQAILLATLLRDAGYDSRIARGALDEAQARSLLAHVGSAPSELPDLPNVERVEDVFVAMSSLAGIAQEEAAGVFDEFLAEDDVMTSELYDQASGDASFVATVLSAEGVDVVSSDVTSELVARASDYFWVEYRTGPTDAWSASHPAFAEVSEAPEALVAQEVYENAVPAELQHRVRFQAFIEQRLGSELVVHQLMLPWERPVANLVGVRLTYGNTVDTLMTDDAYLDVDARLQAAEEFGPTFNGVRPPGGMVFDLRGNVVDPEAAANPAAGIFREVGGAFGRAAGALAGVKKPDEFVALTSHWIEYTLISPSGEEVHKRVLLDLVGPEARADGEIELRDVESAEVARALTRQFTFMVSGHAFPQAYVLDRLLEKLISMEPLLRVYIEAERAGDSVPDYDPGELSEVDTTWSGHPILFASFGRGARAVVGGLQFHERPSLVVYDEELGFGSTARETVDIVTDGRAFLRMENGAFRRDTEAAIRYGTWITHAEGVVVDTSATDALSTMAVFDAAEEAGIETIVLTAPSGEGIDDLDVSERAKANIAEDLARGYAVITPVARPEGLEMTGWWRVEPSTGATLGVLEDGRGATAGEWLVIAMVGTFVITSVVCYWAKSSSDSGDSTAKKISDCGKLGVAFAAIAPAASFYWGVAIAATKVGGLALAILFAILELLGNF